MFTYAIADIHGRFDLLKDLWNKILDDVSARYVAAGKDEKQWTMDDRFKIITLGDYVDRGPQSREVIDMLSKDRLGKVISLMGNHEMMMIETYYGQLDLGTAVQNGFGSTMLSYGQKPGDKINVSLIPEEHITWLMSRPLFYFDKYRAYSHAGFVNHKLFSEHTVDDFTWNYPEGSENFMGRHVVHGHEAHAHGPILLANRTNLDTQAYYTGRLIAGVFDNNKPGGPVDILEVHGRTMSAFEDMEVDEAG